MELWQEVLVVSGVMLLAMGVGVGLGELRYWICRRWDAWQIRRFHERMKRIARR